MLQINIERELNSTSTSIVWNMVSTPEGMARWLADTVTLEGDTLTFTWGSPYDHHEMRKATIIEKKKNHCIRFSWNDEQDMETFVEILKSATKPFNLLLACTCPLVTEFADN